MNNLPFILILIYRCQRRRAEGSDDEAEVGFAGKEQKRYHSKAGAREGIARTEGVGEVTFQGIVLLFFSSSYSLFSSLFFNVF